MLTEIVFGTETSLHTSKARVAAGLAIFGVYGAVLGALLVRWRRIRRLPLGRLWWFVAVAWVIALVVVPGAIWGLSHV